jgi:hypothetical protein
MQTVAVFTVLLLALIFATAEIRDPAPDFVQSEDPFAAMTSDPIIGTPRGGERYAGQIVVIVEHPFDTAMLAHVARNVQLIEDNPPSGLGTRLIVIRVPEREFWSALDRARRIDGVRFADPNIILRPGEADA